MTYLLFDLAVVIILVLFLLRGAQRGLVLSLCGLVAVFVALIGAQIASDTLAPRAADILEPGFSSVIEEQLSAGLDTALDQALMGDEGEENLLLELLEGLGFYDSVAQGIKDSVHSGAQQTLSDLSHALARAVAETVAGVLVFCLAFLLISVAWVVVSHALDLAAHLPVLYSLNRGLGGLFGLLKGCLLLFVAAWVMRLMGGVIPQEAVEQTVLLRFFCTTNPIELLSGI